MWKRNAPGRSKGTGPEPYGGKRTQAAYSRAEPAWYSVGVMPIYRLNTLVK